MYTNLSDEILDNLPIAISVQRPDRTLIYENKAMKELFGNKPRIFCYSRWAYIEGEGKHTCSFCPSLMNFKDGKKHKVVTKVEGRDGNSMFVEINHIPIFEDDELVRFIEIITDVTDMISPKQALLLMNHDLVSEVYFSIIRFGKVGGEPVISEELPFIENTRSFLTNTAAFWIAAVGQGNYLNEGLYGPLPVLDKVNLNSIGFSKVMDSKNSDSRFNGRDYVFIIIFFPPYAIDLFMDRGRIIGFLESKLSEFSYAEDLSKIDIHDLKVEFVEFIKESNRMTKEVDHDAQDISLSNSGEI